VVSPLVKVVQIDNSIFLGELEGMEGLLILSNHFTESLFLSGFAVSTRSSNPSFCFHWKKILAISDSCATGFCFQRAWVLHKMCSCKRISVLVKSDWSQLKCWLRVKGCSAPNPLAERKWEGGSTSFENCFYMSSVG